MKETFGLANAKSGKPPNPKPSPKDFVWPSQDDHDDKVAQKIAATLQELLPARGWKHTDLARELYGINEKGAVRNSQAPRRWLVAEHPIPNKEAAGYLAEVLDIPMSRLLEPNGKFSAFPDMIRGRSDSKKFPFKKVKTAGKTASGKDREKQREYNRLYRAKMKAEKEGKTGKRKYTRTANGAVVNGTGWVLADGVKPPEYSITSGDAPAGHVNFTLDAVMPHKRAMAILHMLQREEITE